MQRKTSVFLVMLCVYVILFGCLNAKKIYAEASYPRVDSYFNGSAVNTVDERGYLHFNESAAKASGERVIAYSERIAENSNKGKFFSVATVKPSYNSSSNTYSVTVYYYIVKWPGNKVGGSASDNYGYCYPDKYYYVDIFAGDVIDYIANSSHIDGDLVASAVMNNHRIDNNSDAGNRIFLQGVYRVDSVTISNLPAGNYVLRMWDNDVESTHEINCGGILGYHELSLTPELVDYAIQYDYQGGALPEGKSNSVGYSSNSNDITIVNPQKNGYTLTGWNEIIQTTDWRSGRITKSTGRAAPSDSYPNAVYSNYLRVEKGITYTLKNVGDNKVDVHFYDTNMNVVETEYFDSSTKKIFTPNETRYVRFCFARGHSSNSPMTLQLSADLGSNVIIKKGSTGNRKYTAKWNNQKIKLTLNPNGGSGGTQAVWYYYGINKFYSNEDCTVQISAITRPTRTGYIYVHYYGDGTSGGVNGERYIAYDGIEFASDLCTDIYKDATLYAKWNPRGDIAYRVNHYLMDTSGVYQLGVIDTLSGTADAAITPTKKDFGVGTSFNTSKSTKTPVTIKADSSTVVNYYYDRSKYSIALNMAKGIDSVSGSGIYYYGQNVSVNAIVEKGYRWLNWTSNTNYLPSSTNQLYVFNVPANNVTLTAKAEIITYDILYYSNGGTMPTSYKTSYTVEDEVQLPKPQKEGYTFGGWYENANCTGNSIDKIPLGSIGIKKFYAKYTPITYSVEYHGNGHTGGVMNPSVFIYDQKGNLVKNGYSKAGYEFVEWNTKQDGTGIVYKDEAEVINLSKVNGSVIQLFAQWKISNYSVYFDANGGTKPSFSIMNKRFGEPIGELPTTTREGYTFDGWYTEKVNGVCVNANTIPSGNITYYAHWTAIKPEISAKKKYYYQNTSITAAMVQSNAQASDCLDGNISNKITITKVIYQNGELVHSPKMINSSNLGEIQIEYTVTNNRGATNSTMNGIVIVPQDDTDEDVEDGVRVYSRFVANMKLDDGVNALDTLAENSVWNTNEYWKKLNEAVSNNVPLNEYDYINSDAYKRNLR